MCGICGDLAIGAVADAASISRMLDRMQDRGPDASGIFIQDQIGLGHRRLSVLDLASTAQQPMVDPELGLAIVFNGCIYNFRELRRELEDKGYSFFSAGDTEVILKAWHAWGPRCVERFFGMFAFAIWERETKRLVLVRDRLGIKPLYYSDHAGHFRFASSLPALLASGDIDTSIDPAALHHYMSWHAVVPPPMTILKGVRKLAPATILTIEPDGRRREEVYWSLTVGPRPDDSRLTEADWREAVLDRLAAAVDRRRVADVPVGVLLSGGLDSSLLVALFAKSGGPMPKTFAVGFESVGGVEGDEYRYSDLVARRFSTDHLRIHIESKRALEALPGAISAMSEPMMSHDSIGFYLLAEEVSRHVTVAQSGQGADEIFGGYHWYPKLERSNDLAEDYARVYFDRDHEEMREAIAPRLMNGDYSRAFVDKFLAGCSGSPIDRALQLDGQIMMPDDPVKRVDNMTMAFGLETRVPFLDHELVELAGRIPSRLKLRDGGKYILKEAARGVVPDEVIDRPKGYFPVPAFKYLRGPFLDFVRDVLHAPAARERNLFRPEYIERLLANPEGELTPKGHSKLWQVAVLEAWLQANRI